MAYLQHPSHAQPDHRDDPSARHTEESGPDAAQAMEIAGQSRSKGVSLALLVWLAGFVLLTVCIFADLFNALFRR